MTEENHANLILRRLREKNPENIAALDLAFVLISLENSKEDKPRYDVMYDITKILLNYFNPLWEEEYGFQEDINLTAK